MLPEQIRNNKHIRSYKLMPADEDDGNHVIEAWERKPHPDDHVVPGTGESEYYGEWENVTAVYKARWELTQAKKELSRLEEQQLVKN